jgi:uncharacterized protein (TIGR03435 family)
MLQTLLADRFKLRMHNETKQLSVYSLVPAKTGPKLQEADGLGGVSIGRSLVRGTMTTSVLAKQLTLILSRTVVDDTGLKGTYKIALTWAPDDQAAARTDDSDPSIFTAIQEQLGLKLQSSKGPVQVFVVDHAEQPSEN